jgi:hypothetical protein
MIGQTQNGRTQPNTFTVGGDRVNYSSKLATPTIEMLVAEMLFNSVISMKGAQFMTMDIQLLPHDTFELCQIHSNQIK